MTTTAHQDRGRRHRVLVTGASKRVGRAIALALATRGDRVIVHYHRSRDAAETTRRDIDERGGEGHCLSADLTDRNAARQLVDDAVAMLGGLDVLVLSAAGYERLALDEVDDAAWDTMLELNLTAPFVVSQRALPALRKSRGSIVFVTCSSATTPFRNHLPYVVSKGALLHLMKTLALEAAPEVRVNAVAPGTVLPPDTLDDATRERLRAAIPLGHLGDPDDVARAVDFLVSSPFVTGHEIAVDGGRSVAKVERFG